MAVPESDEPAGMLIVSNFRSKRTTGLFITDQAMRYALANKQPELPAVRAAIDQCVTHINNNGGWSLVGWIRTGVTSDASDASNLSGLANENMASVTTRPHVSYLFPTDPTVINTDAYRGKRYTKTATAIVADDNDAAAAGTGLRFLRWNRIDHARPILCGGGAGPGRRPRKGTLRAFNRSAWTWQEFFHAPWWKRAIASDAT